MKLDWNPARGTFILRVTKEEANVHSLINEHGLDYSSTASSGEAHVLFTKDIFAAATFGGEGPDGQTANALGLARQGAQG